MVSSVQSLPVGPWKAFNRQLSITIVHEKHNYTLPRLPSVALEAQVADPPSREGDALASPRSKIPVAKRKGG